MLFNSFSFILAFLPLVLTGTLIASRFGDTAVKAWLALASLGFYAWWSTSFVWVLAASISVNYLVLQAALAARPESARRNGLVTGGVAANLALLGWFKYAGFLALNLNALLGGNLDPGQIILPLGISFFTFQKLALLVDVRRREVDEVAFIDYLFFVTFFPQLIAGPIVLFTDVRDQLRQPGRMALRTDNLMVGLTIFALGLAKKTVIADRMAGFATPLFDAAKAEKLLDTADAWTGAIAYSFQIYFDFSGYSDMAIGLAWMFGIALPFNFNSPYKATSIIDFWRRWHITLSHFLKSYLYIPLGGNRQGPWRRHANLMAVMFLGGLWHGAAWTFVLWGALHGAYLVINHVWRELLPSRPAGALGRRLMTAMGWLVTFLAVVAAWVPFRAEGFDAAKAILTAMADPSGWGAMLTRGYADSTLIHHASAAPQWLGGVLALALVLPNSQEMLGHHFPKVSSHWQSEPRPRRLGWRPNTAWAGMVAACLALGLLSLSKPQVFIYFQF